MEAVASGRPAVVTKFSSAQELVVNGVNGCVCMTRSPKDFSRLMKEALTIPSAAVHSRATEITDYDVGRLRESILDVCNLIDAN